MLNLNTQRRNCRHLPAHIGQRLNCTQQIQRIRCCGRVLSEQEVSNAVLFNAQGRGQGIASCRGRGRGMANGQGRGQGMANGQGRGQGMANGQGRGQGMANGQGRGQGNTTDQQQID